MTFRYLALFVLMSSLEDVLEYFLEVEETVADVVLPDAKDLTRATIASQHCFFVAQRAATISVQVQNTRKLSIVIVLMVLLPIRAILVSSFVCLALTQNFSSPRIMLVIMIFLMGLCFSSGW